MATLEKIASLENINISQKENTQNKITIKKRRTWLLDESSNNKEGHKKSLLPNKETETERGSINRVYRPPSERGSIDRVYRPPSERGSINRVYKPPLINLKNLRGNPLTLARLFFELMRNNKNKITKKVTLTEITQLTEISKNSLKTAIRFLLKNKLIERIEFKTGRNGWSQYTLKNSLYLEFEDATKNSLIGPIPLLKRGSISSSSNKTTTTNLDPLSWEKIDVSLLAGLAFSNKHLLQLKKRNTPEIVQESINHFAYGLKHSDKTKRYNDPILVFMGVLRKGEAWIEPGYKSPKELAMQELLTVKKEAAMRQAKMIEDLINLEFPEWENNLSQKEVETIVPAHARKIRAARTSMLKVHFRENVLLPRMDRETNLKM